MKNGLLKASRKGVSDINEVMLASYDINKNDINIYLKYHKKLKTDIFE